MLIPIQPAGTKQSIFLVYGTTGFLAVTTALIFSAEMALPLFGRESPGTRF